MQQRALFKFALFTVHFEQDAQSKFKKFANFQDLLIIKAVPVLIVSAKC